MPPEPNELSQESESQWNEGWGIPAKAFGFCSLLYNLRDYQLSIEETKASESKVLVLEQAATLKINVEGPGLTQSKRRHQEEPSEEGGLCRGLKMRLNVPGRQGQRASWWRRQLGKGIGTG